MSHAAIDIDGVTRRFGRLTAVDQVSFEVVTGERVALLGHNGAGKTTLMKLMLGLLRPTAGRISVLGGQPRGRDAARLRRRIGFLPENVAFDDAMTGIELLRFYARLKGCRPSEAAALLERVGLAPAARVRVRGYSRGMRQRLGLAQALLGEPRLLLLDEPTAGLDPRSRSWFYDTVRSLAADGVAVLLSSHLLTELEERTERILILDHGRLVAGGTLSELRQQAGLPVQVRVLTTPGYAATIAEQLSPPVHSELQDDSTLVVRCPAAEKLGLLARLLSLGEGVKDVDLTPPSLDDVYTHFVATGERP